MKKVIFLIVSLLLVSLVVVLGCSHPAEQATTTVTAPAKTVTTTVTAAAEKPEVIKWRMQAIMAESPPMGYWDVMLNSLDDVGWAQWINEATEGRLEVEVIAAGSVFPGAESLTSMQSGVLECAQTMGGWYAGTMPETYIASGLPLAWLSAYEAYDCYYNYGLYEKIQPVYDEYNIYHIPIITQEISGIIGTFDMSSPDNLKGKNFRVWGAWGKVIEELGGNPLTIAFADQYMAMKLGTIDGCTTGAVALEQASLKEVATDHLITNLTIPVKAILINQEALDELPEDIKNIIVRDSKYYNAATSGVANMQHSYVIAQAVKDYGMKTWTWTDEQVAEVTKICAEKVWPFYGAKSARSQELLDIVLAYLRIHGRM